MVQITRRYSVDEYECVQNEISYETTYYIVLLRLCNLPTFKNSLAVAPLFSNLLARIVFIIIIVIILFIDYHTYRPMIIVSLRPRKTTVGGLQRCPAL